MTYAVLKYLRSAGMRADGKPVFEGGDQAMEENAILPVATGASAGNINVFLAALSWFQKPEVPFTASDNLFWDAWINVGLDKLLPKDTSPDQYARLFLHPASSTDKPYGMPTSVELPKGGSVFSNKDGLLTRAAFKAVNDHLRNRLVPPAYAPRRDLAEMRLAVTLTRADPSANCPQEEDIPRYVAPLILRVTPDQVIRPFNLRASTVAVEEESAKAVRLTGNVLNFPVSHGCPRGGDPQVDTTAIFDAIEASSAFPIAFAPKPLEFCLPPAGDPARWAPQCSWCSRTGCRATSVRETWTWDGTRWPSRSSSRA